MEQYSNIELLTEPSASNHVITVGYGDAHYAALEHSHTLSEITDAAAELATLATKSELTAAVNGINLTLVSDYDTSDEIAALYATKAALTAYVKTTEMNSALTAYVTSQNLGTILESYALTATLANYATSASVSQLRNYVDSTFASVTTVRGMIEGALTGYVSPSSLEAALANYALLVHTHTSVQISDATRTGGQNADAGKAVLLSDGGKIAGAMVPVDGASIVLTNGTISVSDSWLEGEVHGYTKTEVSAVSGTVLNLTKSGQVFDKSLSADATITLNTSGLVVDTGEVVEFDLFLTLGAGVTAHLPGWMTDKGPIYNYAEEGKTLFHVWSYDGGVTWNASKESWLPPDNWKWVTTLSDAIGHQGTSLRDAIGAANNGDVIKFIPELEGTITLEQGELNVDKVITIDGNEKITIDAHGVSRCLYCSSGSGGVVIRGVALGNGHMIDAHGGCLYASGGITLEKCRIYGGVAESDSVGALGGGAMFNGYVSMTECSVTECSTRSASGNADGGAIAVYSGTADAIFTDCEISSASSSALSSDAGAIGFVRDGRLIMRRCRIKNCSGKVGGLTVTSHVVTAGMSAEFTDCVFEECSGAINGSVLRLSSFSNVTLDGCRFSNNISAVYSMVSLNAAEGVVNVTDCVFEGNTGGAGSTISTDFNTNTGLGITLRDCVFRSEVGTTGIVSLKAKSALVTGCRFEDCATANAVIINYGLNGSVGYNIEKCFFKGNISTGTAGNIYAGSGAITNISDCVFIDEKAAENKNSAFYAYGAGETTITNCTFYNVYKSISMWSGSAVSMSNCVDVGSSAAIGIGNGTTLTIDYLLTDRTLSGESYTNIISYDSSLPLFDEDGYTPVEGSQVIDAGDSSLVNSDTDFNGNPRIVGDAVDLGAVEYQGNAAALTINRLNVINRLNRMNLNSLNIEPEEIEEEPAPEPEIIDETEHEEWLRQQELNGGEQR